MATPRETNPAPEMVSEGASLEELARAAETCMACELYREATQVVFGVGPKSAPMMLIGEQPGDAEDQEGEPFVGPAGSVLAEALEEAGIRAEDVYLTNVVKHFRWKAKGKRRLHQTPATRHVRACLPWLEAELALVGPQVLVCLGAIASQALLGRSFRVTKDRGKKLAWGDHTVVATIHPSAVLRATEPDDRERLRSSLVEDLVTAQRLIGKKRRE
ncbi:MAG: uracil-DNA glycosylase [Acidimicrobiia bacterium]|nr:uracil-DNA glycosylase [Acidimicrobiia bacterium]